MDTPSKPLTIADIDVYNSGELREFMAGVLAEGDKVLHAQIQESIRLGIIDEKGNLLKHDIPEDMREGSERDFGG
jgi:hypothetical protein